MTRNNTPTHRDEAHYETVLMRRFHLTPGESEYVFVKRRLPVTASEPLPFKGEVVPTGAKSQKRKVEQKRGLLEWEARKGARGTNPMDGRGKRLGSGRGRPVSRAAPRTGGEKGGAASAGRSARSRSESVRAGLKPRLRPSSANTRLRRKQAHRPGHSVVLR